MWPPSVSRTVPEIRESEISYVFPHLYSFELQVCLWLHETSSAGNAHPHQRTPGSCKRSKIGPSELIVKAMSNYIILFSYLYIY